MQLKLVHIFIFLTRVLRFVGAEKYYPILLWHSAGNFCLKIVDESIKHDFQDLMTLIDFQVKHVATVKQICTLTSFKKSWNIK